MIKSICNSPLINKDLYGLDVLRCLAALSICFTHINQNCHKIGLAKLAHLNTTMGVNIFFVLSGYLITYLMLVNPIINKFDLIAFYKRRMLRIWPLYYSYFFVVMFIVFLLQPNFIVFDSIKYYLFILPNVPWVLDKGLPFLHHYWSLGVEEQYYLIWPIFFLVFRKKILPATIWLVFSLLVIKTSFIFFTSFKYVNSLVYSFQYHTILIGCIVAILNHQYNDRILNISKSKLFIILAWFIIVIFQLGIDNYFCYGKDIILAIAASMIILNLIHHKPFPILWNSNSLKYLGKISFGIYVFHPFVIGFFTTIVRRYAYSVSLYLYFTIVIVLTILLAHISYRYFESYFLNMKERL